MLSVVNATCAVLALAGTVFGQQTSPDFKTACEDLASNLQLSDATVYSAEIVSAGTNLTLPYNPATCAQTFQVVSVDVCRLILTVNTTARSHVKIEGWLPAANWTGRILSAANGGIGGCIDYSTLDYGPSLGFATFGSNGGHDGQSGVEFLNNEDVIIDFASRALHTTANTAKTVTPQLYASNYTKSYYLGCSTGGRQGWKSAQSYPDDFDGIIAGAPALAFNNLTSWSGTFYQLFQRAGPDGFPSPSAWPAIDASMLAQCDALDGSEDGIVEQASLCNAIFRPEALICPSTATNTSTCITGTQAQPLRTLYSPLYGSDSDIVFPALPAVPGTAGFAYSFYAPEPFLYTVDWYKYAVYNNPDFNVADLTSKDWSYAWAKNAGDSNTWSGDLSAFRDRGSKILTYHGQSDPVISPFNSERYYDFVSREMGASSEDLDEFYRFFRVSGLGHCGGGDGAWSIGQAGGPALGEGGADPKENVLMAVVQWVEEGVAPDVIVGTKYQGSEQQGEVAVGGEPVVEYKRAHCRYPLRNVFVNGQWSCM